MDEWLSARWRAREDARLRLARLRLEDEGSLSRALEQASRITQRALGVDRVSVWLVSDGDGAARCIHACDRGGASLDPVPTIADLGAYETTMRARRVLAASDVASDPVTADIVESYFAPLGIRSTLDAPIYREGRFVGMVCCEHRASRAWTDDEADFVISTTDVVATLFLADELHAAQQALAAREIALQEALASEALAGIARGVAHDVNNVLAVVFTGLEVLERSPADPVRVGEATVAIRDAAESAARLVRQLLIFGRPVSGEAVATPLDPALRAAESVLRGLVGEGRALSFDLGAGDDAVALDATQIEQIASNLLVNAREATSEGQAIALRTRARDGEVWLEVEDAGAGMDELTRARVSEPFFTTKQGASSSGLGMAIVDRVVRAAEGRIEIESAPGRGTRVSIRFPAA